MTTRFRHLLPALGRLAATPAPVDLAQVGRDACLSPGQAQRVFAAVVGESPKRYQRRVRLERSAAMLAGSDARIIDIAVASGFDSHEAFTRAFGRYYGLSPRHYRQRVRNDGRLFGPDAVRLAMTSSPCVGLYRRQLDQAPAAPPSIRSSDIDHHTEELANTMEHADYEINKSAIERTPTLFGSKKLEREKVAEGLAELLPAAFGYAMANGLAMAGPPFVRYLEASPAYVTIEAGVPLLEDAEQPPADTGLSAGFLPGGTAAVTVHQGPYETLEQGHAALDRWMVEGDITPAGAPWEIYLTDPAEVPDPKDWQTQIVWPIT